MLAKTMNLLLHKACEARITRVSNSPPLFLALLLLVLSLFNHWQCAVTTPTTDFFTFWGVPLVLRSNPVTNIYDAENQRAIASALIEKAASPEISQKQKLATDITSRFYDRRVDATGSPFLYALVGILSTGDYEKDQRLFIILCFLCFIAAILLLCYLLKYSLVSAILLLIFFSSFYAPVLSDLQVGNTNQIQLLIISLFILLAAKSKPLWAGIIIGIGIMLKPNIFLIWLFYNIVMLTDKKYKQQIFLLLGTGAGVFLAALLSVIYFGKPAMWVQFALNLPAIVGVSYPIQNGNVGLPMIIFEFTTMRTAIIIGAGLVIAFTCMIILTRPKTPPGEENAVLLENRLLYETIAVAGIGCAVMLLSSNLVWLHYYILLIPLVIYLLRPQAESQRRSYRRAAIQLVVIAALLFFSTAMEFILNNMLYQAVAFNIATLLIVLSAFYELWSGRARSA